MPAGKLKLWLYDEQEFGLGAELWPALAEAVVKPGGSAMLRVP